MSSSEVLLLAQSNVMHPLDVCSPSRRTPQNLRLWHAPPSPRPSSPTCSLDADGSRQSSRRRCVRTHGQRTDMGQWYTVACARGWSTAACGAHFQPQPQLCTPPTHLARSMWPPQPPLSPPSAPKHAAVSTRYIHQLHLTPAAAAAAHLHDVTHIDTAPHRSPLSSSNTLLLFIRHRLRHAHQRHGCIHRPHMAAFLQYPLCTCVTVPCPHA